MLVGVVLQLPSTPGMQALGLPGLRPQGTGRGAKARSCGGHPGPPAPSPKPVDLCGGQTRAGPVYEGPLVRSPKTSPHGNKGPGGRSPNSPWGTQCPALQLGEACPHACIQEGQLSSGWTEGATDPSSLSMGVPGHTGSSLGSAGSSWTRQRKRLLGKWLHEPHCTNDSTSRSKRALQPPAGQLFSMALSTAPPAPAIS